MEADKGGNGKLKLLSETQLQTTHKPRQLSIGVVIPTYLRPRYLANCLKRVWMQSHPPEQVVVVVRDEDQTSKEAVREFLERIDGANGSISVAPVSAPGFLPPLKAGVAATRTDIVVFLDDDAEPLPDWLERLERHYTDPSVGGVGGRCVNMDGDGEILYPPASEVGRFFWFGRVVGNMYRDSVPDGPRPVDFFMGGNMSYRRTLLEKVEIDLALNNNVAFNYEVDLGLQVKALGYRLIYDPQARVRHYSAPRPQAGLRTRNGSSIYWYSHNLLYITLKHLRGWKRMVAIAYSFLVGDRMAWGLGSALIDSVQWRRLLWLREIGSAFAGKIRALQVCRRRL